MHRESLEFWLLHWWCCFPTNIDITALKQGRKAGSWPGAPEFRGPRALARNWHMMSFIYIIHILFHMFSTWTPHSLISQFSVIHDWRRLSTGLWATSGPPKLPVWPAFMNSENVHCVQCVPHLVTYQWKRHSLSWEWSSIGLPTLI